MQVLRSVALIAMAVIAVVPTVTAQDVRHETVRFARGTSGTTIQDSITGYNSVRYSLRANAGQTVSVRLDTSNASNFFNVSVPGASEALFIGSIKGNSTSFVIPSGGDYAIDVYLMRNAARRNETANYTLAIHIE